MKTKGLWIASWSRRLVGRRGDVVVARVEAADKAALLKIVEHLKSGKASDAADAAKKYAKSHDDVDELMTAFKKGAKGGLIESGIEPTLIKFGRDVPSPAASSCKARIRGHGDDDLGGRPDQRRDPGPQEPEGNRGRLDEVVEGARRKRREAADGPEVEVARRRQDALEQDQRLVQLVPHRVPLILDI